MITRIPGPDPAARMCPLGDHSSARKRSSGMKTLSTGLSSGIFHTMMPPLPAAARYSPSFDQPTAIASDPKRFGIPMPGSTSTSAIRTNADFAWPGSPGAAGVIVVEGVPGVTTGAGVHVRKSPGRGVGGPASIVCFNICAAAVMVSQNGSKNTLQRVSVGDMEGDGDTDGGR